MISALGHFFHSADLGYRCCFPHEGPQWNLVYDRSDFRHCYQRCSGLQYPVARTRSAHDFSSSRNHGREEEQ